MKKPKSSSICSKFEFIIIVLFISAVIFVSVFYGAAYPRKYRNEVESQSAKFSVSPYLVYAMIKTESGFNAEAKSDKNAMGLMQLLPSTAEYISDTVFDGEEIDLLNPADNIKCGVAYFAYLKEKFETVGLALAAYNAGEGNVAKWLSDGRYSTDGKELDYIPFAETREYVDKVLKRERVYKFLYQAT